MKHIDNFFKLACFYIFFIYHLPKTIEKASLVFHSTVFELTIVEFSFGRLDVLYDLKYSCTMQNRYAGFDVYWSLVVEIGELLVELIGWNK